MEYIILSVSSSESLDRFTCQEISNVLASKVCRYIDRGYKPLGGVSISSRDRDYVISQAMIKE